MKQVLITVGTTNFDSLIKKIDQQPIYQILQNHGFNSVIFQYGKYFFSPFTLYSGKYQPQNYQQFSQLQIKSFDYNPNLIDLIKNSDLIISHCGAGTILECLKLNKIMIGVVNTTLMNNHQLELFEAIVKRNYAYGVNDPELITEKAFEEILTKYDKQIDILSYPKPDSNAFENIICSLYN